MIGRKKYGRSYLCEICKISIFGDSRDIKHHNETPLHKKRYKRHLEEQHREARINKARSGLLRPDDEEIKLDFEKSQREKKYDEKRKRLHEARQREKNKDKKRRVGSGLENELIG